MAGANIKNTGSIWARHDKSLEEAKKNTTMSQPKWAANIRAACGENWRILVIPRWANKAKPNRYQAKQPALNEDLVSFSNWVGFQNSKPPM